jgi:hypothetical protein
MDAEQVKGHAFSRRSALKRSAGAALLISQAAMFEQLAFTPTRALGATSASAAAPSFPDTQFDLGAFTAPAKTFNDGGGNVSVSLPPVYTLYQPLTLSRTPTTRDQTVFANALNTIEQVFSPSPSGALIFAVSYGLPYFRRLNQTTVKAHMPTLLSSSSTPVLEEATPFPSDVVNGLVGGSGSVNPGITKARFNVNVRIESNDMLIETRSDSLANLTNINLWLQGSNNLGGRFVPSPPFFGLFRFQTPRVMFVQQGLPKKIAEQNNFEFAPRMNPDSTMAMGFVDQMTNTAGPAAIVTFVGNSSAKLSNAKAGDYFDNGSICHFSHDIQDLYQFFATPSQSQDGAGEPYIERVQYMFESNRLGTADGLPSDGNTDQFANGGGPAFLNNVFQGAGAALASARDSSGKFTSTNATLNATFDGTGRIGHNAALQQVSRAADGTPMHIRNDGPGFDSMDMPAYNTSGSGNTGGVFVTPGTDIPAGSNMFKLQFGVFVPSADFFSRLRTAAAAQSLQAQFLGGESDNNGLERHITATRRQNFLVPPRRHRSMPLTELH